MSRRTQGTQRDDRTNGRAGAAKGGTMRMEASLGGGRSRTVVFGSASLTVDLPRAATETLKALTDPAALKRIADALTRPGVRLPMHAGKPSFVADPAHPDRLVRVWRGKREPGVFVHGEFKVVE